MFAIASVCNSVRVIASASFYFQHSVIFIRRVLCNNDRSDCFPSVRKFLFHACNTSYAYSTSSANNICLDANNRVTCSSTISGCPSSSFSLKSFGFPHLPGSTTWATPWRWRKAWGKKSQWLKKKQPWPSKKSTFIMEVWSFAFKNQTKSCWPCWTLNLRSLNHVSIQNRAILLVSASAPEANKGVTAFSQSASNHSSD